MKIPVILIGLLFLSEISFAQIDSQAIKWEKSILANPELSSVNYLGSLKPRNFAPLWTQTDNSSVYGFIGKNYQRIRIKILSAIKSKTDSTLYNVIGVSLLKGHINHFRGTIKIFDARTYKYKDMNWGVDETYKDSGVEKEGIILAKYKFREDSNEKYSGVFEGILLTNWYITNKGQLRYDDIESDSDGYCNNQFVGTWKSYETSQQQICNWGDYRIPFSGEFDAGVGDFSPADKYSKYGWENLIQANNGNKKAEEIEERKWWK